MSKESVLKSRLIMFRNKYLEGRNHIEKLRAENDELKKQKNWQEQTEGLNQTICEFLESYGQDVNPKNYKKFLNQAKNAVKVLDQWS